MEVVNSIVTCKGVYYDVGVTVVKTIIAIRAGDCFHNVEADFVAILVDDVKIVAPTCNTRERDCAFADRDENVIVVFGCPTDGARRDL